MNEIELIRQRVCGFFAQIKREFPELPRVVVSALAAVASALKCYDLNAPDEARDLPYAQAGLFVAATVILC